MWRSVWCIVRVCLLNSSTVTQHSYRLAEEDDQLRAAAALRAVSFYAYPPEREFAGRVGGIVC